VIVVPKTVSPFDGELIETDGPVLSTVTLTGTDIVSFPVASRATALNVWSPS